MPFYFDCLQCHQPAQKPHVTRAKKYINNFCSDKCRLQFLFEKQNITKPCGNCGKETTRQLKQFKRSVSSNIFCSQSCSAKYSNAHKTKGTRVSKLEVYLQQQLLIKYPEINFIFNDKTIILSELDIYLPDYKLAFELNGIIHYEPIYGKDKLTQIQNNDNRKFQACLEQDIELVIMDTSSMVYFKESKAIPFFQMICDIIDSKL